jgi:hypothetical protein
MVGAPSHRRADAAAEIERMRESTLGPVDRLYCLSGGRAAVQRQLLAYGALPAAWPTLWAAAPRAARATTAAGQKALSHSIPDATRSPTAHFVIPRGRGAEIRGAPEHRSAGPAARTYRRSRLHRTHRRPADPTAPHLTFMRRSELTQHGPVLRPTGSRCDRTSRHRASPGAPLSPHAPRRAVRRPRDERDRIRSSERARPARLQLAGHRATGPLAR